MQKTVEAKQSPATSKYDIIFKTKHLSVKKTLESLRTRDAFNKNKDDKHAGERSFQSDIRNNSLYATTTSARKTDSDHEGRNPATADKHQLLNVTDLGAFYHHSHNQSQLDICPTNHLLSSMMEKDINNLVLESFHGLKHKKNWVLDAGIDLVLTETSVLLRRNEINDTFKHAKTAFAHFRLPAHDRLKLRISVSTFWEDIHNLRNEAMVARMLEIPFGSLPFAAIRSKSDDRSQSKDTAKTIPDAKPLEFGKLYSQSMLAMLRQGPKAGTAGVLPSVHHFIVDWTPEKCIHVAYDEPNAQLTGITAERGVFYSLSIQLPFPTSLCIVQPILSA